MLEEYTIECSIMKVFGTEMPRLRRRRGAADPRRLRLHQRVPDRAPLPRLAHQPHLRGHQRDQPPDHPGDPDEARRQGRHPVSAVHADRAGGDRRGRTPAALHARPARPRGPGLRDGEAGRRLHRAGHACSAASPICSEKQQHLLILADMIIDVYAMESVTARVLEQMRLRPGRRRSDRARHDVRLRRLGEPARRVPGGAPARQRARRRGARAPPRRPCAPSRPFIPIRTIDTKTRIAKRLVADGGFRFV